jgi:hypothetical protein
MFIDLNRLELFDYIKGHEFTDTCSSLKIDINNLGKLLVTIISKGIHNYLCLTEISENPP